LREARLGVARGRRELESPLVDGGRQSARFNVAAGGETQGGYPAAIRRGKPWRSRRRHWGANPSSGARLGENTAGVCKSSGRIEKKMFREESVKSGMGGAFHLHYDNLAISGSPASKFFVWFRFQLWCCEFAQKSEPNRPLVYGPLVYLLIWNNCELQCMLILMLHAQPYHKTSTKLLHVGHSRERVDSSHRWTI
jgi:hypothetical protein